MGAYFILGALVVATFVAATYVGAVINERDTLRLRIKRLEQTIKELGGQF